MRMRTLSLLGFALITSRQMGSPNAKPMTVRLHTPLGLEAPEQFEFSSVGAAEAVTQSLTLGSTRACARTGCETVGSHDLGYLRVEGVVRVRTDSQRLSVRVCIW